MMKKIDMSTCQSTLSSDDTSVIFLEWRSQDQMQLAIHANCYVDNFSFILKNLNLIISNI